MLKVREHLATARMYILHHIGTDGKRELRKREKAEDTIECQVLNGLYIHTFFFLSPFVDVRLPAQHCSRHVRIDACPSFTSPQLIVWHVNQVADIHFEVLPGKRCT